MKKKYQKKAVEVKKLAEEHIDSLFKEAKKQFHTDPTLSNRYVEIAHNVSMKCKVKIAKENKRRFCKTCHTYLVPGNNCRIRISGHKVIYFCTKCKNFMRFPYSKEKKAKSCSNG